MASPKNQYSADQLETIISDYVPENSIPETLKEFNNQKIFDNLEKKLSFCPFCNFNSPLKAQLLHHISKSHLLCPHCTDSGKIFKETSIYDPDQLSNHILEFHPENPVDTRSHQDQVSQLSSNSEFSSTQSEFSVDFLPTFSASTLGLDTGLVFQNEPDTVSSITNPNPLTSQIDQIEPFSSVSDQLIHHKGHNQFENNSSSKPVQTLSHSNFSGSSSSINEKNSSIRHCDICQIDLPVSEFVHHISAKHFVCIECERFFSTQKFLNLHLDKDHMNNGDLEMFWSDEEPAPATTSQKSKKKKSRKHGNSNKNPDSNSLNPNANSKSSPKSSKKSKKTKKTKKSNQNAQNVPSPNPQSGNKQKKSRKNRKKNSKIPQSLSADPPPTSSQPLNRYEHYGF